MKYELKPSNKEIDDAMTKASDAVNDGFSLYPGMTYEAGVEAALAWAIGEREHLFDD